MCREKAIKFSTLHWGTSDEKFGLRFFIHINLGGSPYADVGSDKYQVWPKKCGFVCHLHKGDDRNCDF